MLAKIGNLPNPSERVSFIHFSIPSQIIWFHFRLNVLQYGALDDSKLQSHLPITLIKKGGIRSAFWIFGKIGVKKRFRQKTSMTEMATYNPKNFGLKKKKSHI